MKLVKQIGLISVVSIVSVYAFGTVVAMVTKKDDATG